MLEIHSLQAFKSLASAYSTTAAYMFVECSKAWLGRIFFAKQFKIRREKTLHRLVQSLLGGATRI